MATVHDVPTYIYALVDPRTDEVRYVGKTIYPQKRLHDHLMVIDKRHCTRWMRALKGDGHSPVMAILETVPPGGDWVEAERRWIAHYRGQGARLTNLTSGGDGASELSPESQAKKIASMKKTLATPERRASISARQKAAWNDPEERAKRIAAQRASNATPEGRATRSRAQRERFSDPVACARQSEQVRTALSTPEARRNLSAGQKASWADPAKKQARLEKIHNTQTTSPIWQAAKQRRKLQFVDPERKREASEKGKARWADPAYKEKVMTARAQAQERKKTLR